MSGGRALRLGATGDDWVPQKEVARCSSVAAFVAAGPSRNTDEESLNPSDGRERATNSQLDTRHRLLPDFPKKPTLVHTSVEATPSGDAFETPDDLAEKMLNLIVVDGFYV